MKNVITLHICICLLLSLFTGCGNSNIPHVLDSITTSQPLADDDNAATTQPIAPDESGLSFPGQKVDDATLARITSLFSEIDSGYSRAARCFYRSVDKIPLSQLFYSGYSAKISELSAEERAFLNSVFSAEDLETYDLNRLPASEAKAYWEQYFNSTFPTEPDMSPWIYSSEWECYYHLHNDSNIVRVNVSFAYVQSDNTIDVYYYDALSATQQPDRVMRLQSNADGSYFILLNAFISD